MDLQPLIEKIRTFVREQSEQYQVPSLFQIELANKKGQWLAKKLGADRDVVLLGTLLMDCQLGVAIQEGKIKDHAAMGVKKTEEILSTCPALDAKIKTNILACVQQHHGVKKFSSLEAEICCNADCYRFASIKGFIVGLRFTREMPLNDLLQLLSNKADEKWNALSINICKKELEPEYAQIKSIIKQMGL